jgi:hypothetical protein
MRHPAGPVLRWSYGTDTIPVVRNVLTLFAAGIVLFSLGCNNERTARLEKQNQELREQLKKSNAAAEFDMQEKCAREAKAWYQENYPPDKDTIMQTYSNHYNRAQNKCFIFIEWNYRLGTGQSWASHMSLWDVNDNVQRADFSQNHIVYKDLHTEDGRVYCEIGKPCSTENEFEAFTRPFLND